MNQETPRTGRFRRRGFIGKFVVSFGGLVVLVLTVNGGLGTWFMYRETAQILAKSQSEKAAPFSAVLPRSSN